MCARCRPQRFDAQGGAVVVDAGLHVAKRQGQIGMLHAGLGHLAMGAQRPGRFGSRTECEVDLRLGFALDVQALELAGRTETGESFEQNIVQLRAERLDRQ